MSRRMGKDKVFLRIGEKTFIELLFENAKAVFDDIFISIDNMEHAEGILKLDAFRGFPQKNIITDGYTRCGPIGGICSVFDKSKTDKFSIVPADVPKANIDVLALMFELCHEKPCIFRRDNGYIEPLIGAYERSCYDTFRGCLDKGKYSIHKALENNGFKTFSAKDLIAIKPELNEVDFKNEFFNVNVPEDYDMLIKSEKQ